MATIRPMTVPKFVAAKAEGRKLAMLTAYDFLWAELLDASGVDAILVGDSLGMVVQGKSSTIPVTLDEIIYHAEIVCRAVNRAMVLVDMPFMTYQVSPQQAVANAGRIIKETGAAAVKIEGGVHQAETIRSLQRADIPVMAHVGMRPQSQHAMGGLGRVQRNKEQLLADALAAQDAGAFAVLIELVPRSVAAEITASLNVPTIGIAAGPECDGQVLVTPDVFGLTDFQPKFLKRYANLRSTVVEAAAEYVRDVHGGLYPDADHSHD